MDEQSVTVPSRQSELRSVCVFCGSREGADSRFSEQSREIGRLIANSGLRLVYGGGNTGLMGAVANAALEAGGNVVGVIPEKLMEAELAHSGLSELHIVGDMHTRKALMARLSDAFIALPGGLGTLEELFEVWTWGQLGFHCKHLGLLNVAGYYSPLLRFLDKSVELGFVNHRHRELLHSADSPKDLLRQMSSATRA